MLSGREKQKEEWRREASSPLLRIPLISPEEANGKERSDVEKTGKGQGYANLMRFILELDWFWHHLKILQKQCYYRSWVKTKMRNVNGKAWSVCLREAGGVISSRKCQLKAALQLESNVQCLAVLNELMLNASKQIKYKVTALIGHTLPMNLIQGHPTCCILMTWARGVTILSKVCHTDQAVNGCLVRYIPIPQISLRLWLPAQFSTNPPGWGI